VLSGTAGEHIPGGGHRPKHRKIGATTQNLGHGLSNAGLGGAGSTVTNVGAATGATVQGLGGTVSTSTGNVGNVVGNLTKGVGGLVGGTH
jgi:hypothetical protein